MSEPEGPQATGAGAPVGRSVFATLYSDPEFVDRFEHDPDKGVDVIIPVMHTNELWRANLLSIYREIPVRRLIISDGGVRDDSLSIAGSFPRTTVLDHRQFISLGYCLRKLIEAVETDWFVYLHSDVFLAPGWFDAMVADQHLYDWFESRQHTTILAEVPVEHSVSERSYSGAQMGRRRAFDAVIPRIDDDFLYRNEDIILAHLVRKDGFKYGRAEGALIYHQQMAKESLWRRDIAQVSISIRKSAEEDLREKRTQLYGLLKYLDPDREAFDRYCLIDYIYDLLLSGQMDWNEFRAWVERTNPGWLPIITRARTRHRVKKALRDTGAALRRFFERFGL